MKILILLISLSCIGIGYAEEKTISLDEVAKKVKESNFNVLENAERVYQAKETITFSKRNLLPRLNFWNVLKLPFDWASAIDLVQDVAPFIVPNNWFRVSQSKLFYLAQKEQYRALWANEVTTAKLLYINTLRDQDFLELLEVQQSQLEELVEIVKTRSIFGEVPPQVVKFLQIRKLELAEDIRSLKTLVYEENKAMSYLMGIPQEADLKMVKIGLPQVEDLRPISFDTFIFRAMDNAPELNQYKYIKESLRFIKKEAYFSFLGSSTTARGAAGGIFNNIPLQDGLGFGLGSSLRITKSQSHIIDLNANATKEVIKKNLYNLVNNFNSYIENIENQNERFKLATDNYETVKTQLVLGMNIDPLEMLTSIENLFDASISLINYKYEVVNTMEKLKRSIFNGDYSKKEGKLEAVINGVN
jgi:outer membrane protein TolC